MDAEQQFHEFNMKIATIEAQIQRASFESRCLQKQERYSKDFATLADAYRTKIDAMDVECKDLRHQQKAVKDDHEVNLFQKRGFSQLNKLMQVKLKVSRQVLQSLAEGRVGGELYGTRAATDLSTAGVERLVIE